MLENVASNIDRKFRNLTTNEIVPNNEQGQAEYAWCSYGVIIEVGNKFCIPNLSVISLEISDLCSLLSHNFTP